MKSLLINFRTWSICWRFCQMARIPEVWSIYSSWWNATNCLVKNFGVWVALKSIFYTFLEWDTDDVLQWLNSQGLEAFRSGFQGESFYLLFKIESLHKKIPTEKKKLNASLLVKKIKALNLNMHKKASCHNKDDSASTDARKHELIHRLAFLTFSAEKKIHTC